MKTRTFWMLLVLFALAAPWGRASIMSWTIFDVNLTDEKDAAAKAGWSPSKYVKITGGGLGWEGPENGMYDGWIQTKPHAVGTSWRPTPALSVRLEITPVPKPYINESGQTSAPGPGSAYVRYSPDCKHWSTWQALAYDEKAKEVRSFSGSVQVPQREREAYWALLEEYGKQDVPWRSDEEAAVAWILKSKPDYFKQTLPFVGWVEFLYEAPFYGGQRITGLKAHLSFAMSGLHYPPKDAKTRENHSGPWRFKAE